MNPLVFTSVILFAAFLLTYLIFNLATAEISDVNELTKWTWIVWTVYYLSMTGVEFGYNVVVARTLTFFSSGVSGLGMVVAIGVCVLFFDKSRTIREAEAEYGIGVVYFVNTMQHFAPVIIHPLYVAFFGSTFKRLQEVSGATMRATTVLPSCLVTIFTLFYLLYMDPNKVYKIDTDFSTYVPFTMFAAMGGGGIFVLNCVLSSRKSHVQ